MDYGHVAGTHASQVDSRLAHWGYLGLALCVAVLFASLIGSLAGAAPVDRSSVDAYLTEYGGSRQAYEEIVTALDCATIQDQLNRATDNHRKAELGSVRRLVTLGYLTAAEDQLVSSGCGDQTGP